MNKLFVIKESNTFTDAIECIGLASIVEQVFNKIGIKPEIIIEDKGYYYQITLNETTEEILNQVEYFDLIQCIKTKKNKDKVNGFNFIDYEEEKANRKRYFDLNPEERKTDYNSPPLNYDIFRMLANIDGYWNSFQNMRAWKCHFNKLLGFIFETYNELSPKDETIEKITQYCRENKIPNIKVNALQDINPDKGKGVNQKKARSVRLEGLSDYWLRQLVRFTGVWRCCLSCYFDKDYKTYSLVPNQISMEYLNRVYLDVKDKIRSTDSVKNDIILLVLTTISLIRHYPNYEDDNVFYSPLDKISGLQFAYYKSLGNKPAVTNIGFIAIPEFVRFSSKESGDVWIELLSEHLDVIRRIHNREYAILNNYRQFVSANSFEQFFGFMFDYSALIIRNYNQGEYILKLFTITNMEVLMETQEKYKPIMENNGFRAIAEAIRNSTIVPTIHKNKKDIIFGLSHQLKISSRSSETLMEVITNFIQQYNEKVMLKDFHQKEHRRYITTDEVESFVLLFDQGHSPKLIAGLLVAFGYAKEPSKGKEVQETKEDKND